MTITQFFVYKRPIAWTALAAIMIWGYVAYMAMPQRHDPIIPIRIATVITIYPGADAEKVEQEVTRKIETQVGQCGQVEKVYSLSRQNLSVVFIELFESVKDTEEVWQDITARLGTLTNLPTVHGRPLHPIINKDFGETVAMLLTISSPKVSDFEIQERAKSIQTTIEAFRRSRPKPFQRDRMTAVLVYPNTVGRSYVVWLGTSFLQYMTEKGLIEDGHLVEPPSTGCLDFQVVRGKTDDQVRREALRWERNTLGAGMSHPDIWPGILVRNLSTLGARLGRSWEDKSGARPDRYSYRELLRFADRIRDRLKQYPTIGKIDEIGVQNETIYLYYSNRRFAALDLSPQLIAAQLDRRNINLPGGRVETSQQSVFVHPTGEFTNEQQLGEVVLDARGGYPAYLRDMVDIVRGYEDPPGVMNFRTVKVNADRPPEAKMPGELTLGIDGHQDDEERTLPKNPKLQTTRAITLAIRQIKGSHIDAFARDVSAALDSLKGVLPDDLRIEKIHNEPIEVHAKIKQFDQNLLEAVAIVILVALVFMEWRNALLVAVSIPVTVAMTLGICQLLGIDLQQVSIAAMIIAFGLLVDDPVVAGDAINREIAAGNPRDKAAWLGAHRLTRAIFYATVTNAVAFLPLLMVEGKTGNFIYSLPVVVVVSLGCSFFVSITFVPLLGYYLLRGQKGFEDADRGGFGGWVAKMYRRFSTWSLNHKAAVMTVATVFLVGGISALPMLGTAFFPKDLHTIFSVGVYLTEGSPIRETRNEAMKVLKEIDRLEGQNISGYTTFVGQGSPRFWISIVPEQRTDNYAQILVNTVDPHVTQQVVERLKQKLPPQVASARVVIEQLETGPPIGVPVQIRLFGDDLDALRRIAAATKQELRRIPGTDNIHDDWDNEVFQLSATIDPAKANLSAGITNEDVAVLLQTGLSGLPVTYLREEDRLIPIAFRLRSDERMRIEDINNLDVISGLTNARVPISQIADFSAKMVSPKIRRRDLQRCITVKCDTRAGTLASTVVNHMQRWLKKNSTDWPPGYRYQFGGEYEEQSKGFKSVGLALTASMVLIYLALVLQFNSVTKPLVVFVGVPFGIVGGMLGLLPTETPFGFMAFLGVASLAGVIVSHVIVLFDYIEEARMRGEPLHQAVIDSALVRLRPVLVTVLATVGGLIPLALKGGPLWEPMCYVQITGLLLATLVTLGIVPVVYVAFVEFGLIRWSPEEQKPTS
ncbi:MAG: efflux RND transporter permease subunit [Thermoguttaceae bacterium]